MSIASNFKIAGTLDILTVWGVSLDQLIASLDFLEVLRAAER